MENINRKTILLVEDEALIALLESKHLKSSGYNVIHALTGEEAVELICGKNIPADLILMDIDLGSGMDGTTAAQMILQQRKIPILFLSSHTEPEIVEKTEKITSFGYVVKDSSFTVLLASMKMAFRLNEVMQEKEQYAEALRDRSRTIQYIPEYKKMEDALKRTEHRLAEISNNLPVMISVIDINTLTYKFVNRFYENILKRSSSEITGKHIREIIGEDNFKLALTGLDDVRNGKIAHVEGMFEGPEGRKWLSLSYMPQFDAAGKVFEYIVLGIDITHLKRTEEELNEKNREMTEILKEKNLLIKEVHHRIKNNMMMVFSLITLQAGNQENEEAKDVLLNAAGRIKSMSLLYERLYNSEYNGTINSLVYLRPFIREVFSSFSINNKIRLLTDIDDITLDPRKISPLFVILNELITNSMKYAFKDRENGEISVSMQRRNGGIQIVFADNGAGLPDPVVKGNSKGFGLNLVRLLVQQIEGTLDISVENGTRFEIGFE